MPTGETMNSTDIDTSDATLWQSVNCNDQTAFERLVKRHRAAVMKRKERSLGMQRPFNRRHYGVS
jgi:hypothetical protein